MRLLGRFAGAVAALALLPLPLAAAPRLRAADARIEFSSPTSCTVELAVTVDGATEVEHRIEAAEGAAIELIEVRGATTAGEPRTIGRTRALLLRPSSSPYTLHYSVSQPPARSGRCPLWVPAAPSDGRTRSVQLRVRIPDGATAGGTMPGFEWAGAAGTATIGHLPAFVRVPFAAPGQPAPWDIAAVMDAVSVATLILASALWMRRGRR
jgi:hypothetical protein